LRPPQRRASHVQFVGELRTREYEKEYGNKKKIVVKQRVCEVALDWILKLDRAERQEEPPPTASPATIPPNASSRGLGQEPRPLVSFR
jgi:hypothetical protein